MKRDSAGAAGGPGAKRKCLPKLKPKPSEQTAVTAGMPGPTTLEEAFSWPTDMVRAVCSDSERSRRLLQMAEKTWRVSSDYSGLRTEEVAFGALAGALEHCLGQELKYYFVYSCDCDGLCQSMTLGTRPDRKPQHCFKDLNSWLTPEAAEHLNQAEALMPKLHMEMSKAQKDAVAKQRSQMYEEMGNWLYNNYDTVLKQTCDCMEHLAECEVGFGQVDDHEAGLEVAGLTCIAWSVMGKHEGFAHESMRPFYIWCCLMRRRQPMLLVIESALRCPRQSLGDWLGDLYHLVFFDHAGPLQHGWPIGRPRMYCLAFLRSRLTFVGSPEEYSEIFSRSVCLPGDALFFLDGTDEEVQWEKTQLALNRRVQLSPGFDMPWELLYPPNKQMLIEEHKKLYEQMREKQPGAQGYICDLDQNIGFMTAGSQWPCIVRHGTIYSLEKKRHATPTEVFAAQGFPLHEKCNAPYTCGFHQFFKQDLNSAASFKMVGNAMFVPTLGSMILYAMSSAEFVAAELIRPTSRLFSDVEDSQAND